MRLRDVVLMGLLPVVGCGETVPSAPPTPTARATITETRWTSQTELFVEYPALVTGESSRFAVHLTRLDDFAPLGEGRVTVRLIPGDGRTETFSADTPSRPGIFGVDVRPTRAGSATLQIEVQAGTLADRHDVGEVTVHADVTSIPTPEAPQEEAIAFLKEQQWSLDFATALVSRHEIRDSLRVPGEVVPRAGGDASVTAPVDGRVVVRAVPTIGAAVGRGQELLRLLPPASTLSERAALEAARDEAAIALTLARENHQRVQRLFQAGAVPARRLDETRAAEATTDAHHRAALARLAHLERSQRGEGSDDASLFIVRSPIDGVVMESLVAAGTMVQAGQRLLRIVDPKRVAVVGRVPERDLGRLAELRGAEIEIAARDAAVSPTRLLSIGRVVDPATRTAAVAYEVDSATGGLALGQTVFLRLFVGTGRTVTAIPDTAVVDDGGRPIVFVQRGGESFVRVPVTLGARESGFVEVLGGPAPKDRVVTRGAYLVRLAALSTQVPAHGHVH